MVSEEEEKQRKVDQGKKMLEKFRQAKSVAKPSPFSVARSSVPMPQKPVEQRKPTAAAPIENSSSSIQPKKNNIEGNNPSVMSQEEKENNSSPSVAVLATARSETSEESADPVVKLPVGAQTNQKAANLDNHVSNGHKQEPSAPADAQAMTAQAEQSEERQGPHSEKTAGMNTMTTPSMVHTAAAGEFTVSKPHDPIANSDANAPDNLVPSNAMHVGHTTPSAHSPQTPAVQPQTEAAISHSAIAKQLDRVDEHTAQDAASSQAPSAQPASHAASSQGVIAEASDTKRVPVYSDAIHPNSTQTSSVQPHIQATAASQGVIAEPLDRMDAPAAKDATPYVADGMVFTSYASHTQRSSRTTYSIRREAGMRVDAIMGEASGEDEKELLIQSLRAMVDGFKHQMAADQDILDNALASEKLAKEQAKALFSQVHALTQQLDAATNDLNNAMARVALLDKQSATHDAPESNEIHLGAGADMAALQQRINELSLLNSELQDKLLASEERERHILADLEKLQAENSILGKDCQKLRTELQHLTEAAESLASGDSSRKLYQGLHSSASEVDSNGVNVAEGRANVASRGAHDVQKAAERAEALTHEGEYLDPCIARTSSAIEREKMEILPKYSADDIESPQDSAANRSSSSQATLEASHRPASEINHSIISSHVPHTAANGAALDHPDASAHVDLAQDSQPAHTCSSTTFGNLQMSGTHETPHARAAAQAAHQHGGDSTHQRDSSGTEHASGANLHTEQHGDSAARHEGIDSGHGPTGGSDDDTASLRSRIRALEDACRAAQSAQTAAESETASLRTEADALRKQLGIAMVDSEGLDKLVVGLPSQPVVLDRNVPSSELSTGMHAPQHQQQVRAPNAETRPESVQAIAEQGPAGAPTGIDASCQQSEALSAAQQQAADARTEIKALRNQIEVLEKRSTSVEESIHGAVRELLADHKPQVVQLVGLVDAALSECDALRQELSHVAESHAAQAMQRAEELAGVHGERNRVSAQLEASREEIKSLVASVSQLTEALKDAEAAKQANEAEAAKLKSEVEGLQSEVARLMHCEKAAKQVEAEAEKLKSELERLQKDIERLTKKEEIAKNAVSTLQVSSLILIPSILNCGNVSSLCVTFCCCSLQNSTHGISRSVLDL
jgi:hypothetical protein